MVLIIFRLCLIIIIVLFLLCSLCSMLSSVLMLWKCRLVVGLLRMYRVWLVLCCDSFLDSFMCCVLLLERVVVFWFSLM